MSVKHTSWVWEHSQSEGNDRLVLLCLADMIGDHEDDWYCWPKIETIQSRCRIGRSTVKRAIANLSEMGEVHVTDRHATGQSNEYRMPEVSSVHSEPTPRSDWTEGGSKGEPGGGPLVNRHRNRNEPLGNPRRPSAKREKEIKHQTVEKEDSAVLRKLKGDIV